MGDDHCIMTQCIYQPMCMVAETCGQYQKLKTTDKLLIWQPEVVVPCLAGTSNRSALLGFAALCSKADNLIRGRRPRTNACFQCFVVKAVSHLADCMHMQQPAQRKNVQKYSLQHHDQQTYTCLFYICRNDSCSTVVCNTGQSKRPDNYIIACKCDTRAGKEVHPH